MKIGISKKIVIPYGIGLSIFLFITAFSLIKDILDIYLKDIY